MADNQVYFAEEIQELETFISNRKDDLVDEVLEILNTFVEMLSFHGAAVHEFSKTDFVTSLQDFMAEKAEYFYKRFKKEYNETRLLDEIFLEMDVCYIYDYSSILIGIKSSWAILYPHSLLIAANYWNFIPVLCKKLAKMSEKIPLLDFIKIFVDLQSKSNLKLHKRDVELLKKIIKQPLNTRQEINRFKKSISKRHVRLVKLGAWRAEFEINFPALGLVPYLHLATRETEIPKDAQKYINAEQELFKCREKCGKIVCGRCLSKPKKVV